MKIVPEMIEFAKWDPVSLHSRVEVSGEILNYIKLHALQNSERKREILPDEVLKKLLKFDIDIDGPLYYTKLQSLIGRLIIRD
jgi:chromatin remodeling complex protein RSC6